MASYNILAVHSEDTSAPRTAPGTASTPSTRSVLIVQSSDGIHSELEDATQLEPASLAALAAVLRGDLLPIWKHDLLVGATTAHELNHVDVTHSVAEGFGAGSSVSSSPFCSQVRSSMPRETSPRAALAPTALDDEIAPFVVRLAPNGTCYEAKAEPDSPWYPILPATLAPDALSTYIGKPSAYFRQKEEGPDNNCQWDPRNLFSKCMRAIVRLGPGEGVCTLQLGAREVSPRKDRLSLSVQIPDPSQRIPSHPVTYQGNGVCLQRAISSLIALHDPWNAKRVFQALTSKPKVAWPRLTEICTTLRRLKDCPWSATKFKPTRSKSGAPLWTSDCERARVLLRHVLHPHQDRMFLIVPKASDKSSRHVVALDHTLGVVLDPVMARTMQISPTVLDSCVSPHLSCIGVQQVLEIRKTSLTSRARP